MSNAFEHHRGVLLLGILALTKRRNEQFNPHPPWDFITNYGEALKYLEDENL